MEVELDRLREEDGAPEIIGISVPMKALRQQLKLMAGTNGRVLIYGESGTGKELVARAIHRSSERVNGPFVEVNCAAIPEDLIESELFGHRRTNLDGATDHKIGKLQKAHGGTFFLDEVGDMSLKTQSKVLRALDEHRFEPVGAPQSIQVDVRVVAATNKNLEKEIERGNFREDLFYRLNVILHPQHRIEARHLPLETAKRSAPKVGEGFGSLQDVKEAAERDYILRKLEETGGNVTRAAELLGLERSNLYRKMKSLGILTREAERTQ